MAVMFALENQIKKIAPDAKIVMELVRKNPNRFTQDELNQEA